MRDTRFYREYVVATLNSKSFGNLYLKILLKLKAKILNSTHSIFGRIGEYPKY